MRSDQEGPDLENKTGTPVPATAGWEATIDVSSGFSRLVLVEAEWGNDHDHDHSETTARPVPPASRSEDEYKSTVFFPANLRRVVAEIVSDLAAVGLRVDQGMVKIPLE